MALFVGIFQRVNEELFKQHHYSALNTFITHLFYAQHLYFMLMFQNSQ